MKISIYIFILLLNIQCKGPDKILNQDSNSFLSLQFQNLNQEIILKQLFPSGIYIDSHIVWQPSYDDYFTFKNLISDDGYCHTRLDTIISLNNGRFILLKTNKYINQKLVDCHPCSPLVSIIELNKTDSTYTFIKFKKDAFQHGTFGTSGKVEIETFENGYTFLKVSSNWIGTGSMLDFIYYYSINSFEPVFSFIEFESNGGMFEEEDSSYKEIKRVLDTTSNGGFLIKNFLKEYDQSTATHQLTITTQTYTYNDEKEQFYELCQ